MIDRTVRDRTTSEGQAYAMFFALVDNDRSHFEQILSWTTANLADGDLGAHLPSWCWGRADSGEWKKLDDNSASDADLWMAYTLLEAGRLWHDPRYTAIGNSMVDRIAREEVVLVPGLGTTLAPGPHGFQPSEETFLVNPSYLPLPLLVYMAKAQPQGPWATMRQSLPGLLDRQMDHGYAMDWVRAGADGVHPAAPPREPSSGQRESTPGGSYDAIRVYLWLGLSDPSTPGRAELLAETSSMAAVLRSGASPPLEVDTSGQIVHREAPIGFTAAVIPYLVALGMKQQAAAQRARLLAAQDPGSGLFGSPAVYYDQNLALFSTAWSEQRFRFERDGKLHLNWK